MSIISKADLQTLIENLTHEVGIPLYIGSDFEFKDGHKPEALKDNQIAVYIFYYPAGDIYLKIGKVGGNSNPRYLHQHYDPNSNGSTLAKSLCNDNSFYGQFNKQNVGEWIRQNTKRLNIVFNCDDRSASSFRHVNSFIEAALHFMLNPKYEK